jgi:hypothetical protein
VKKINQGKLLEKAWFSAFYLSVHSLLSDAEKQRVYTRLRKKAKALGYEAYEISPLQVGFRKTIGAR